MFTLFDLLKWVGGVVGAVFGAHYGYEAFAWPGALVGALLGGLAGLLVGDLPWMASWAWMRYDLKRSSVPRLKQRLQREYFVAHLLIGELVSRGEPLEQFRAHVAALMRSGDAPERHFGEAAARLWFPDLLADPPSGDHETGA